MRFIVGHHCRWVHFKLWRGHVTLRQLIFMKQWVNSFIGPTKSMNQRGFHLNHWRVINSITCSEANFADFVFAVTKRLVYIWFLFKLFLFFEGLDTAKRLYATKTVHVLVKVDSSIALPFKPKSWIVEVIASLRNLLLQITSIFVKITLLISI